jgi:hypothetical protein
VPGGGRHQAAGKGQEKATAVHAAEPNDAFPQSGGPC